MGEREPLLSGGRRGRRGSSGLWIEAMEIQEGEASVSEVDRTWTIGGLVRCMLAGLGMFCESYFIFTTGQMHGIWRAAYPECWAPSEDPTCKHDECSGIFNSDVDPGDEAEVCDQLRCTSSLKILLSGSEFIGIMLGMLLFAYLADRIGRRLGSLIVSAVMLAGALVMVTTPFSGGSTNQMFTSFAVGFAVLGFGIGGEYPLSSVSATERAEEELSASRRGSYVVVVFSMQGLGALIGSMILLLTVRVSGAFESSCDLPDANALGFGTMVLARTWRSVYLVGFIFLLLVVGYRLFFAEETAMYDSVGSMVQSGLREKLAVLGTQYPARLIGTSLSWFLWDVCFYGNKLFISTIVSSLRQSHSLVGEETYILVNNAVAMVGYIFAAILVDRMGRRNMQVFGFTILAAIFVLVGALYPILEGNFTVVFGLYLVTSFFGQLGPNPTTYLLPAETFPTEVRSVAHGISAFAGKTGALVGTTIFAVIGTRAIFITCGIVSAAGTLITLLFVADVSHLKLKELDSWHEQRHTSKKSSGGGVTSRNLSLVERWRTSRSDSTYDLVNEAGGSQS